MMGEFVTEDRTVVFAPGGKRCPWVVDNAIDIDGEKYAPITNCSKPFKRFLRSVRKFQKVSELVNELKQFRAEAQKRKCLENDPFAAERGGDAADADVSKYRRKMLDRKLWGEQANVQATRMLQVVLPEFVNSKGKVVSSITTTMPCPQQFNCRRKTTVILKLDTATLHWVSERHAALQRLFCPLGGLDATPNKHADHGTNSEQSDGNSHDERSESVEASNDGETTCAAAQVEQAEAAPTNEVSEQQIKRDAPKVWPIFKMLSRTS